VITESTTDPSDFKSNILFTAFSKSTAKQNKFYFKRPAFTMKQSPFFAMGDRSKWNGGDAVMSIPAFNRMIKNQISINETAYSTMIIKLKKPKNLKHQEFVIKTLRQVMSSDQQQGITIYNYFDNKEAQEDITKILDWIFNVIIGITMFLCFFSLCSSMSANLFDQTKEIGILRAMGFNSNRIAFVYFMEAFILVMASCICGIMIGTTVSVTMVL